MKFSELEYTVLWHAIREFLTDWRDIIIDDYYIVESFRKLYQKVNNKNNIVIGKRQKKQLIHNIQIMIDDYEEGRFSHIETDQEYQTAKELLKRFNL